MWNYIYRIVLIEATVNAESSALTNIINFCFASRLFHTFIQTFLRDREETDLKDVKVSEDFFF